MSESQAALKRVGAEVSAAELWNDIGQNYAEQIDNPYHRHRLSVIEALLPAVDGKSILDFGCGEGVMMRRLRAQGATRVVGIDPDAALIDLARASGLTDTILGGADATRKVDKVDCILCANVLAYMNHVEERVFYEEARRLLADGGHLVVTHSNELFDLFTCNSFTRDFFRNNFATDVAALLTHPAVPARTSYNIRENPLTYSNKLAALGFQVERTEFINFHPAPPLLVPDDGKAYRDTLSVAEGDRWKLMFQCSTFGVRARCS